MTKALTMNLKVLRCTCGNIHLRRVRKMYYTCETCGTTMSRAGKVLVQGKKTS